MTNETLKWIANRKSVWTKKLNKARKSLLFIPLSVHEHINAKGEETTALRVLEELANIKTILKKEWQNG